MMSGSAAKPWPKVRSPLSPQRQSVGAGSTCTAEGYVAPTEFLPGTDQPSDFALATRCPPAAWISLDIRLR